MEKLSQSEGSNMRVKKTGNNRIGDCNEFLEDFKKFYPEYFDNKNKKKNTFMDLIKTDIGE